MINYCASNPCANNGLCVSLINDYRCVCLDDYTGLNCEETSNECLSNPCLNNGTCIDQVWNYTCQCPMGFTGSNCQIAINYCESSPCIKGLCVNQVEWMKNSVSMNKENEWFRSMDMNVSVLRRLIRVFIVKFRSINVLPILVPMEPLVLIVWRILSVFVQHGTLVWPVPNVLTHV